jgi:hypothetical protein
MDASKLLNIILDLTSDTEKSINDTLNTLINNINSNQPNEISINLSKLKEYFDESISNEYNPSNLKIINSIGASDYFGSKGIQKLEEILNKNSYNVQKTVDDLQKYLQERTEFLTLIDTTSENLQKLKIQAHFHNDNTFEIGLLMPIELTENKISNLTKELNHWDKVFKTLNEITTGSVEDTKINFINNGSLEFYIDNIPQIAACLAITVERVIKLYKNIVEIRIAKENLKELGISTGEQKTIDKQEKEIFNKGIEAIVSDIVKEFAIKQIDSGRVNELKIAMKGHINYIAKCVDNGMVIEINPPEISEPIEAKETDTEDKKNETKKIKDNYDKTLKQIKIVQKSMDTIKTLGKTGIDIVKYITEGEEPDGADL